MAAVAALIAHGGIPGAIVEAAVALSVAGVLLSVWIRERRVRSERATELGRPPDDDPA